MASPLTLADSTPASRDRYADFLRAASILVVIAGHWLMAIVYWGDGAVGGANALEVIPGLWVLTWVLQVMPLFFFVGGFANFQSIRSLERRGGDYAAYVSGRMSRLLTPTVVFVGFWLGLVPVLEVAGAPAEIVRIAGQLVGVPVWFLGVYVAIVALAPPMLALHGRYRWFVPAVLAAGAAGADWARIGLEIPLAGHLNFAFVWLFAHQLGYFYADGTFARWGRAVHLTMAGAGLAALAWLTSLGIYSPSMVGMADGKASNNSPPSICIIALTVWLVGLAMTLRPAASRWLGHRGPWAATIGINMQIMTIYLWHLTAFVLAVPVIHLLGWPQPEPGTFEWWALRPLWIAVLALFLVPFVLVFGRFERPKPNPAAPVRRAGGPLLRRSCAVSGVLLVSAGLQAVAVGGFAPGERASNFDLFVVGSSPWHYAAILAAGMFLLRAAVSGAPAPVRGGAGAG